MALAGDIKEFGLADIFQIVSLQKKTGALWIMFRRGWRRERLQGPR